MDQSDIKFLHERINRLTKELDRVKNNQAPTVPIYDSTNFPQDAVEGQVVVAQSSVDSSDTLWIFRNGTWQETSAGGIRFNVYNDSGTSPGFLDVTTHDYMQFLNEGNGGMTFIDTGDEGISVSSAAQLQLIAHADINVQTIDGGVYIVSVGSGSPYIQLQSAGWVEADGTVIQLNGSEVIELNSLGILHPAFPSQIQVGTSETGGSVSKIYIGNAGGQILIDESGGTTIHGGSSLIGGVSLPLLMDADGSYIQLGPYIQMTCYAFGTTLPTPLTTNQLVIYGYEHSLGHYSLWAMLGTNRTQLATS